jgi:hypothetical protein
VRTLLLLYGLAFVVRAMFVVQYPDPAYPDSYYYVEVARALASGQGLNVDFVWIFAEVGSRIPDPAVLPIPSNAHWLPLASLVQVPFIVVLGPTAIASALPVVLIGSLSAPLTWAIARDVGASRTVQVGAGIIAAIPAAGTVFMVQPENFAIFQPLAAATLWLAGRGFRGDRRAYVLAGLLVGVASLSRNDAFLLGAAVGLVFVIDRVRAWRAGRAPALPFSAAAACFALYLLVLAPWWIRQLVVFGSVSPTASTGSAIWLTEFRQWNSITADTTIGAFLSQGAGPIITSRLLGFVAAAANFAVIVGSVVLVPFMAWGAWRRRRSDDFIPWFIWVALMFTVWPLLFPLHIPGGAFIHSAVGMAPHAYILALEGIAGLVLAIAHRRPAWEPAKAIPIFTWALVAFVVATALLYAPIVRRNWAAERTARAALAAELEAQDVPPTDRLMSIDAAGFKYFTGRPGVTAPDDPIETIREVAQRYDIRWLVLERSGLVDAFKPIIALDARPSWVGPARFVVPAAQGGPPALALYPVCFRVGDDRCGAPDVVARTEVMP